MVYVLISLFKETPLKHVSYLFKRMWRGIRRDQWRAFVPKLPRDISR